MPVLSASHQLVLHAAATFYMVGVIWLVQLVHYPMFALLDADRFRRSHAFHSKAISLVVIPAMLLELWLAVAILWHRGLQDWTAGTGFGFLAVIWLTTFQFIVPLHERLQRNGFDAGVHMTLCRWNWVRTAAWSARGLIAAWWINA